MSRSYYSEINLHIVWFDTTDLVWPKAIFKSNGLLIAMNMAVGQKHKPKLVA